jgi:hypothetical protein
MALGVRLLMAVVGLWFWMGPFGNAFAAEAKMSRLIDGAPELKKGQGYLLIKLDVAVDNARMVIERDRLDLTSELKARPDGFLLIRMPSGKYYVDEVQVPYFNLPYRVDTSDDPRWAFTIEPNTINYLGELIIKKPRTRSRVSSQIRNRSALHADEFCSKYSEACVAYPFRFAANYRDDFISALKGDHQ